MNIISIIDWRVAEPLLLESASEMLLLELNDKYLPNRNCITNSFKTRSWSHDTSVQPTRHRIAQ